LLGATLFIVIGSVVAVLSKQFDVSHLQQFSNRADNIYSYEYYDHFLTDKKIIIIPSGCWTAAADVYTDPVSLETIGDGSARLDNVINEISHNLYRSDISFYQFGFPDPGCWRLCKCA
jgi:hypothetical protein